MRVMVYDNTQGSLSYIWSAGQYLGGFDKVISASSWDQVYEALRDLPEDLDQLQFWGHGAPGAPYLNGDRMDIQELKVSLGKKVNRSTVIWFRACNVFTGTAGRSFAETGVATMGCTLVGHTHLVSAPWPMCQSGGRALRVGERPAWSPSEGVNSDGSFKGSSPWAVNTCLVTRMNPPGSWFQD